jgi:hypothetical protein
MKKFQHVVYCQFAIDVEVEVCGSASRIKPHFTHIYPRHATIKQFPSFEHHCLVLMPKVDDVNECPIRGTVLSSFCHGSADGLA